MPDRPCRNREAHEAHDYCPGPRSIHQVARCPGVSASDLARLRRDAYDLGSCPNGPDEDGTYPCDPKVLLGGGYAECQVCGRVAAWGRDTTKVWANG